MLSQNFSHMLQSGSDWFTLGSVEFELVTKLALTMDDFKHSLEVLDGDCIIINWEYNTNQKLFVKIIIT